MSLETASRRDQACVPATVVICSRNRHDLLAATLNSILDGDSVPAEIIVVDQSEHPSPPSTVRTVCRVRHLPSDTRGLSSGRNLGAVEATEEVLVFTDDDMLADARWLDALVGALHKGTPSDAATGRVLPGPHESAGAFVPSLVEQTTPAAYAGRLNRDVLAGGNMAIRRGAFFDAGAFDIRLGAGSRFPAAEDNDFGFRLLERGARIVYVPDAVLYHRAWRGSADYIPLRFGYGRGKGGYYAKHLRLIDPHMLKRMLKDLGWRVVRAPRLVLHPRLAAGELAYGAGILRGVAEWFVRREPLAAAPSAAATTGVRR